MFIIQTYIKSFNSIRIDEEIELYFISFFCSLDNIFNLIIKGIII